MAEGYLALQTDELLSGRRAGSVRTLHVAIIDKLPEGSVEPLGLALGRRR